MNFSLTSPLCPGASLADILTAVQISGDPAVIYVSSHIANLEATVEEVRRRGLRLAGVPPGGLTVMPAIPLSDAELSRVCREYCACRTDAERQQVRQALHHGSYPLFELNGAGSTAIYHPADYVWRLVNVCYRAVVASEAERAELERVSPYLHISPVRELVASLRSGDGGLHGAALPDFGDTREFTAATEEAMGRLAQEAAPAVTPETLFPPGLVAPAHRGGADAADDDEAAQDATAVWEDSAAENDDDDSLTGAAALAGTELVDEAPRPEAEYFRERDFQIISSETYFCDDDTPNERDKRLLALYLPGAISEDLCRKAARVLEPAATKKNLRAATNGGTPPDTGIAGYYDYLNNPTPHKCRETEFTRRNWPQMCDGCEDFLRAADRVYSRNAPAHHSLQHTAIPRNFQLFDTAFSTVTVNRNFRTAAHRDRGDFRGGLGLLCVVDGSFTGCHLAIQKLGVAFQMRVGDVLLFDTSLVHGNTEVTSAEHCWTRTSVVCYLRTGLLSTKCELERRRRLNRLTLDRLSGASGVPDVIDLNAGAKGLAPLPVPARVAQVLSPTQHAALSFMSDRAHKQCGGVVAMTMGLGKTLLSLTLCFAQQRTTPDKDILIVTPKAIICHWIEEISKWRKQGLHLANVLTAEDGGSSFGKITMTYAQHLHRCRSGERRRGFLFILNPELMGSFRSRNRGFSPALIIMDEGHRMAAPGSALKAAIDSLRCPVKFVLSGTPLQNNAEELYELISWTTPLAPRALPLHAFRGYSNLIRKYIEHGGEEAYARAGSAQTFIRDWMRGLVFCDMAADLPRLHDYLIVCGSSAQQQDLEAAANFGDSLSAAEHRPLHLNTHPLCYFTFVSGAHVDGVKRGREEGEAGALTAEAAQRIEEWQRWVRAGELERFTDLSGKMRVLIALVLHIVRRGEKVVIFSQYVAVQDLIHRVLVAYEVNTCTQRSRDDKTRRDVARQQFNDNADLSALVASTKIGAYGLDFTAANHVVLFDSWWNPQADAQAIGRVHRRNQRREVCVYRLLSGLERSVLESQKRKLAMFRCIMHEQTTRSARAEEMVDAVPLEEDAGRRRLWETLRAWPLEGGDFALQSVLLYNTMVTGSHADS